MGENNYGTLGNQKCLQTVVYVYSLNGDLLQKRQEPNIQIKHVSLT